MKRQKTFHLGKFKFTIEIKKPTVAQWCEVIFLFGALIVLVIWYLVTR